MAGTPRALGALSLDRTQPYVRPKVKQDRPAYIVINNGFFDHKDKFKFPGEMLYFDGEPNANLYPLNKMAYDKIQQFLDMLDMFSEEKAKKDKVKFIKQAREPWHNYEEVEVPQVENVMGMPKNDDGKDNIR